MSKNGEYRYGFYLFDVDTTPCVKMSPIMDVTEPRYGEWYPIETAPKDGTRILIIPTGPYSHVQIAEWVTNEYAKVPRPYFRWDWFRVGYQREIQPLWWMPLPEPKKE